MMQNYIQNFITEEEFEMDFSLLWKSIMDKLDRMKINLESLKNFYPNLQSKKFGSYITFVYHQFEELT